jgi:hypothetical protein
VRCRPGTEMSSCGRFAIESRVPSALLVGSGLGVCVAGVTSVPTGRLGAPMSEAASRGAPQEATRSSIWLIEDVAPATTPMSSTRCSASAES